MELLVVVYASVTSSEVVSHRLQAQELYQLAHCLQVIKLCVIRREPFTIYTTAHIMSSFAHLCPSELAHLLAINDSFN